MSACRRVMDLEGKDLLNFPTCVYVYKLQQESVYTSHNCERTFHVWVCFFLVVYFCFCFYYSVRMGDLF